MQRISAQVPDVQADALDAAVADGRFTSRSAAVRQALDLLMEPPRAEVEVVRAEVVPVEPGVSRDPSPFEPSQVPGRSRDVLEIVRRIALPLLGTGVLGLATGLAVGRRRAAPQIQPVLAVYSEEFWRIAVRRD